MAWKKEINVVVPESLRRGMEAVKSLLRIFNNYPVLAYIPVHDNSWPDFRDIWSSVGPLDGYENIVLAKCDFGNGCIVDICLGSVIDDGVFVWELIEFRIEWRDTMLGVWGAEPVRICLEKAQISMLFSAEELRRKKNIGDFVTDNELAEQEYYEKKAAEIIEQLTRDLRKRIVWPKKFLLGGDNMSNLQKWA